MQAVEDGHMKVSTKKRSGPGEPENDVDHEMENRAIGCQQEHGEEESAMQTAPEANRTMKPCCPPCALPAMQTTPLTSLPYSYPFHPTQFLTQ